MSGFKEFDDVLRQMQHHYNIDEAWIARIHVEAIRLADHLVYFDCAAQVELISVVKDTPREELDEIAEHFGGGEYDWYPCPAGMRIVRITPRDQETGLKWQITYEGVDD